ncbi:MAG: RNA-directed DNA polymerase, partial [Planctomycetales bacterium]|nr:RNA-directed DNA polymerase [Planctomycetales bacterium]
MSILRAKYEQLAPHGAYLTDVVVLAQAWKKAHTAIRRHNWYADVLELDCSTIDLERQLAQWAKAVSSTTFAPIPMMLVPAPKNARWDFPPCRPTNTPVDLNTLWDVDLSSVLDADADDFEAWTIAEDVSGQRVQKIRPLAHLSIRDQTLATAVMLCLADAVESAQGDPSERNGLKAQMQGIFSYGNRLHCRWDQTTRPRPRAFFGWGNSRTYSQYFQDYRVFLARPRGVFAELAGRLNGTRELFVISLDIKSFFDGIERQALVAQLKALYSKFVEDFGLHEALRADDDFWSTTERIFNWEWRPDDRHLAPDVMDEDKPLPMGLPQGLIASGFLANAYMVEFDRRMSSAIDGDVAQGGIVVRDYCRYVDDIRLVVEARREENATDIAAEVQSTVAEVLQAHCNAIGATIPLVLNEDKTTAKPYSSISKENNVSALMELHQQGISGTFDTDSLIQATGGLDGLLWLSEQLEDQHSHKSSPLELANIAVANTDVREDTVKRFAATRIAWALRMRLAMTDTEDTPVTDLAINGSVSTGAALNHEFEATARKLIKCWANNPALALLLRVGLDLFPHPRLLGPVLEALESKLYSRAKEDGRTTRQEVLVAEYVSADLLRAGATETGHREDAAYPDSADISRYRQQLAAFARRVLLERGDRSPWYLKQQAMLYLAVVGDHSVATTQVEGSKNYWMLHQALLYSPCKENDFETALPFMLVGQQLVPAPERFAAWLIESLRATKSPDIAERCVLAVATN